MNSLLAPAPTRVVGVLNVTPDSFSDGGHFLAHEVAVARGTALHGAGAALVDVGGESTRPGAVRVAAAEELRRVLPVVRGHRGRLHDARDPAGGQPGAGLSCSSSFRTLGSGS